MLYAILPRRAIRNKSATFCSYAFFAYAAMFFCIVQLLLFFFCFCLRQRGFLHTWFLACSYFCLRRQCFYNIDAFMMSSFYIKKTCFLQGYRPFGLTLPEFENIPLHWKIVIFARSPVLGLTLLKLKNVQRYAKSCDLKVREAVLFPVAWIDAPDIESIPFWHQRQQQ